MYSNAYYYLDGKIANLRIQKGEAIDFSVVGKPTEAYTSALPVTIGTGNTEPRVIENVNFQLNGDTTKTYTINTITDDGEANDEVAFSLNDGTAATLATGEYDVDWIRGANMVDDVIKLTSDGVGVGINDSTVLALNDNDFVDYSYNGADSPHTITNVGGNVTATTETVTGTSIDQVMDFNGTNAYLNIDDSDDFDFGSDPFTIDFWVKASNTTGDEIIISRWPDPGQVFLISRDGNTLKAYNANYSNTNPIISASSAINNNWNHVALTRDDSDNFTLYVNGSSVGSYNQAGDLNGSAKLYIGDFNVGGLKFNGSLANLRIQKGEAIDFSVVGKPTEAYTSTLPITISTGNTEPRVIEKVNFQLNGDTTKTYTINTITDDGEANDEVAFSLNDGTTATLATGDYDVDWIRGVNMVDDVIKLTSDGAASGINESTVLALNDNDFVDYSFGGADSPHTITNVGGNVTATTETVTGTSIDQVMNFGGSSDLYYLTAPTSTDFSLSGDFAIDFWIYLNSSSAGGVISESSTPNANRIALSSSNGLLVEIDDALHDFGTVGTGAWKHIGLSRSSGTVKAYLDGSQLGSDWSDSGTLDFGNINIGRMYSNTYYYLDGKIANLRIQKGEAIDFSIVGKPTEPYGAGSSPANQTYTAVTSTTGQFNTTAWDDLNSGTVTESTAGQSAFYSVSFDDKATFQIYDTSDTSWRNIASNSNAITGETEWVWCHNTWASWVETWTVSAINEQNASISEAMTVTANQQTWTQFNAISDAIWNDAWSVADDIDIAVSLKTTSASANPQTSSLVFNYDWVIGRTATFNDWIATWSFEATTSWFWIGTKTWTVKNVSWETKSFIVNKF